MDAASKEHFLFQVYQAGNAKFSHRVKSGSFQS